MRPKNPIPAILSGLRLRPLPAQHQRVERGAHVGPSARALRPSASRSAARRRSARRARARRRSSRTPSATIFMPARISASARPRASSMPTWRLRLKRAGAGQHEIAEAAQPGERFAAAAGRAGQARQLGEPARDQRRQRVVAEPQPFDDAGGDRDDVLHRARRSRRRPRRRCRRGGSTGRGIRAARARSPPASCDAARIAVGSCARDLGREARARQHDDRMRRARLPPRSPPTCAAACSASSPLVALTITAPRRQRRATRARITARQPCDGTADTTSSASRSASASAWVTETLVGKRHVGQVDGVGAARRHLVDERAIARPEPDVVPDARRGARRAPCPSCPAPSTVTVRTTRALPARRSVPVHSRLRFDRCLKTMSAAAAAAAITAGAGLPSAYAIGGSAIDASTDPSEMYLRQPDDGGENRERRRNGERRQHREHAARGRHALAAAEPQPDRIDVADDRREPGGGRQRRAAARPARPARRSPRLWPCRAPRRARRPSTPDARITFAAPRLPLPTWRRSRAPPARQNQRERNRSDADTRQERRRPSPARSD